MKIFYKVYVVTEDDLDMFSEEEYDNLDDINPEDYDFNWDYAQMALIDADTEEVLLWNDNIHTNIEDNIDNFLEGYKHSSNEFKVRELIMLDKAIKDNYSGVRY